MTNMTIRKILLASTALVIPRAFESGKPGWKMDGDKLALDANGNPIYINSEGVESSVKGDTIATLNNEAKNHRQRAEAAETSLNAFKGADGKLLDPQTAIKAVETVSKIDAKALIDAGEVDKVKDQIKSEFTTQLTEAQRAIAERDGTISAMRIDGVFKGSEFINDRVAMPRDFFEAAMRGHFKDENGKITAYDRSGNPVMSKKNLGEHAAPDEALELLVEMHPQKDTILKANTGSGSGNNGGGGARGSGRTIRRADFEGLPPAEQASIATKGEVSIVD